MKISRFTILFSVVFLVLLSIASTQPADTPWPMFGHDPQHTGRSPYVGPKHPEIIWKFHPDMNVESAPVFSDDGVLYVAIYGGILVAINPDGTEKWRFISEEEQINSSPSLGSDGTLYFIVTDYVYKGPSRLNFYYLFALNPNGTLKWKYYIGTSGFWNYPVALGEDDTIYLPIIKKLHALNPDGTLKWEFEANGNIRTTPVVTNDGSIIITTGISTQNFGYINYLVAVNPDGTEKWSVMIEDEIRQIPIEGPDGTIYINYQFLDDNLHAFNSDGSKKWTALFESNMFWWMRFNNDTIYLLAKEPESDTHLFALNPADGSEKWRVLTKFSSGAPIFGDDNTIYVSAWEKKRYPADFYLLAINPDGSEKWRTPFQDNYPVWHPVMGSDGTIYQGTSKNLFAINPDGSLKWTFYTDYNIATFIAPDGSINAWGRYKFYRIEPDGTERWSFKCSGSHFMSSPAIDVDGTIYICNSDNFLYAVNPDGSEKWNTRIGNCRSCPAIGKDGVIFVGSSYFNSTGNLFAISREGSILWRYDTGIEYVDRNSVAIDYDNNIYFCADIGRSSYDFGYIYSIRSDGTERWMQGIESELDSSPAIDQNGTIYFNSADNYLYSLNSDGRFNWTYHTDFESSDISPVIGDDGTIYNGDGFLFAINPDGTRKWNYSSTNNITSTPAIAEDGSLYFGMGPSLYVGTSLYAIDHHGKLKWTYHISYNNLILTQPIIDGSGTIYVSTDDRNLYAIYPDGTLKWKQGINVDPDCNPAIGADGRIYIVTRAQYLIAIGEATTQPEVDIYSNKNEFSSGDTAEIKVKVDNQWERSIDMYAALEIGGSFYWYSYWGMTPNSTEIESGIWDESILSLEVTNEIPRGEYRFYTAITEQDTLNLIDFDTITIELK